MVLTVKELTVSLQNTDAAAHSGKIWEEEESNRGEAAGTCPGFPPRGQTEQGALLQTDAGDSIVPALLGCVLKENGGPLPGEDMTSNVGEGVKL